MIKNYFKFLNESDNKDIDPYGEENWKDEPLDAEIPDDDMVDVDDLYDVMGDYLDQANVIYCNFTGDDPEKVDHCPSPEEAMDCLDKITKKHKSYKQAQELMEYIDDLQEENRRSRS